jgi:hypothetical protein
MPRKTLKVYYQNVGKMKAKLEVRKLFKERLESSKRDYSPDVIVLTETNLNHTIANEELFDEKVYKKVFRDDSGVGVLIAVKFSESKKLPEWSAGIINDRLKDLWITFQIGDEKINICVVYVSQTKGKSYCKVKHFQSFLEKLKENCKHRQNETFFVIGDFNYKEFHEFQSGKRTIGQAFAKLDVMFQAFTSCELTQYNKVENDRGTMLDYVFSNRKVLVLRSPISFRDERPDQHPTLRFFYELRDQNVEQNEISLEMNSHLITNHTQVISTAQKDSSQNDLQKQIADLANDFQDFKISMNETLQAMSSRLSLQISDGLKEISEKIESLHTDELLEGGDGN